MIIRMLTGWLENAILGAHQWFRHPLGSMLDIETESDDGRNLVSVRGDLASVIRLNGLRYLPTEPEIETQAAEMRIDLKSMLDSTGRSIQFLFLCDPARTPHFVNAHIASVRNFAEQVGLNMEPLFQERAKLWSSAMCVEETYAVLWTRRSVMNSSERSTEDARAEDLRAKMPKARRAQRMWLSSPLLAAKHEGFVRNFRDTLRRAGVETSRLSPHEALREMREVLDPSTVGSKWRAKLPSDPPSVTRPDSDPRGDLSHFLNPPLSSQLFRSEAYHRGFSQVDMGRNRYAAVDMTLAPEVVLPFTALYEAIGRLPCRISFLLDGGGAQWMNIRNLAASVLAIFSTTNRRILAALELMDHKRREGESYVRFRCSAATWGPSSDPDLVHQRHSQLESAIQGWGVCEVSSVAGDPVQGMMSSALGMHCNSTAPGADAPLTEVMRMMPWNRQGSPWLMGSMLYMTPEGRPYRYDPVGSKRTAVTKIIVGRPGTAKSFLMITQEIGLIMSAAAVTGDSPKLPFVRIADIGYGGKGMVDLLKASLPAKLATQVVYARFQNSPDFSYNIFGTQPGCRTPLPHERESIINIIATKMTPEGGKPYESMSGLIARAVDEAYKFRSDEYASSEPRAYQRFVDAEIDEQLDSDGPKPIQVRERATWWDVVDALHVAGETRLMTLAQNYAVPLLEDLITAAHVSSVSDLYHKPVANTQETMVELFIRLVIEMTSDLPVLSHPTRFDLGEARVVVLDMEEVCRTGGSRTTAQTQVMYLVAMHILARDFLLKDEHLCHIPERYQAYNQTRIREFSTTVKLLGFDEMHVTAGCPQIEDQIVLFDRIGRKNAFQMALSSQNLSDFPAAVVALTTEIYITGLDNGEATTDAVKRFGLSDASDQIIRTRLTGPHKIDADVYGAPFLAIWRLDDGERQVEQMLYNLIGPIETWALSTRPDDVHLRDRLYQALGHSEAWRRLAIVFPAGTARDEVERRANMIAARGRNKSDAKQAVIGGLVAEIIDGMGIAISLRAAGDLDAGVDLERKHRAKTMQWLSS